MAVNDYLQPENSQGADASFGNIDSLTEQLTPEIINNLKRMIELGKKPDGQKLSTQDLESCMEAVIRWEVKNIPLSERSGYIAQPCGNKKQKV